MKNLDLREKYKKALSLLTAFMLMHAPATALAEKSEESYTNETTYTQMLEETEVAPMTAEEFTQNVEKIREALAPLATGDALVYDSDTGKFVPYSTLYDDIPNIYYFVNRKYVLKEGTMALADDGIILTDNLYDSAWLLSTVISFYNQKTIRKLDKLIDIEKINCVNYDEKVLIKYLKKINKKYVVFQAIADYNKEIKKKDPNKVVDLSNILSKINSKVFDECLKRVANGECDLSTAMNDYNEQVAQDAYSSLIDISILCYNPAERRFVHSMFENIFNAYKNGRFNNEYYEILFIQSSVLDDRVSLGVKWLVSFTICGDSSLMIELYAEEKYKQDELAQYFDKTELENGNNFVTRRDIQISRDSDSELERLAFDDAFFKNLPRKAYIDIMEAYENDKVGTK